MREIMFRGKRVDNGEWAYGDLAFKKDGTPCIRFWTKLGIFTARAVIPETVGQYTGLTDKNGKKIFEGDIVHAVHKSNYGGLKNTDFGIGVVKYCDSYYGGASYEIDIIGKSGSRVFSASLEDGVEVIGNIHDNPELVESEVKDERLY